MKYFSFAKNSNDVLLTLIVLICLGAGYFFIYVPQNEKSVQEQRFRSLQNIDKNIHAKIDNSIAIMDNLLKAFISKQPGIDGYIKSYSREQFTLSYPVEKKYSATATDSNNTVTGDNNKRMLTLWASVDTIIGRDTFTYKMNIAFNFSQFIKSLLPPSVFDQYIVFDNGEVAYEDFSSGIAQLNDSLSGKKSGIATSGIKSLNVSGKDYKLFFQPVSITVNRQLVVTGLLSGKHYQQEKNQLPSQIVLLLLTVVLIAIVAYPWIKLYQMGNTDRLTITDGIAALAVSMLLMSLIVFTAFKYNTLFRPDTTPNSMDTLAREITQSFKKETASIYQKLTLLDKECGANPKGLFKNIVLLDKDSIAYADKKTNDTLQRISAIAKGANIDRVFWLNTDGVEEVNWITANINSPHGNFAQRDYFKNIVRQNGYLLDNKPSQPFYLDQITSWTTGVFTSVLSIPSAVPGVKVAAVAFDMKSLHLPVLPAGFKFAITDDHGKVLYHSDVSRNLNENLVEEFTEKEKLKGCLEAATSAVFTTKYFSNEYKVNVRPINNLPYFMVIFEDTSYQETRDVEIYSFTFSMLVLLFAFLICQLLCIFLISSKRSFFKNQSFDTSWVGPKISANHQYNIATINNVALLILAIIFFNFCTILTYLFILLFSVTFSSVFLNTLFARKYKKTNQEDNYHFKRITIGLLLVFVLIINLAALRLLDGGNLLVLWLFQLLVVVAGIAVYRWGKYVLGIFYKYVTNRFFAHVNYAHGFTLMSLTRLLLTSGLPVLFFFLASYNYEQNIDIRYRHLQFAKNLPNAITDSGVAVIKNNQPLNGTYYFGDKAWINDIAFKSYSPVNPLTKEERITTQLLGLFHINISDKAISESSFFTNSASDSSFFYNPLLQNAGKKDSVVKTYLSRPLHTNYLTITSSSLNYKLPALTGNYYFKGWVFWLILAAIMVVFHFIIYNILNKLFCLTLPDLSLWAALDDAIVEDEKINNLLFIIGLPGSGKLSRVLDKIKNGEINNGSIPLVYDKDETKSNIVIADLINIPDIGDDRENSEQWKTFAAKIFDPKNKLIIVNHFEYNIQDAVTNRIKLNLLEQLMLRNQMKIIILSTIHPIAFLDSVSNQSANSGKGPAGQDMERWNVLLGHFRIVIFPLQTTLITEEDEGYKALYKETAHTHFLSKMRHSVLQVSEALPPEIRSGKNDEMILKLQGTAHYFYMYIWQSLTSEEKFLLYDLAEDNLVNSFDDYNLNMLLAKGAIIRTDGSLRLFNKGFRNFILTAIGNTEAIKIRNNMQDNGNWGKLKNPILLVIAAILVFLLASQEEAYSKVITYVATLGAGIPTVIKLFSFLDKSASKTS